MDSSHAPWILIVGAAMVLAGTVEAIARRLRFPSVVAYLLLGMLLRLADVRWGVLADGGREAFALFADIGIIALLFRVGLESNPKGLIAQLRPASVIWVSDVTISGVLGYLAARYGLGFDLAASLVIGVALTATSIGIATAAWRDADELDTPKGRLMLDVAELDDISGVVLFAMLFALLPVLGTTANEAIPLLAHTAVSFGIKFALFATFCLLFARFVERPLTSLVSRLAPQPQRMLSVAGVGFVIAALAGWLGFSFAIGALFAGLVFSRDPKAVRAEARFTDLYAFFTPFFFLGIGLEVDISSLGGGLEAGGLLLAAAVVGKFVAGTIPAFWTTGAAGALLLGVSLIPRAEIALVIAHQGHALGMLPEDAYAALVLVSGATCLVVPWVLGKMFSRRSRRRSAVRGR